MILLARRAYVGVFPTPEVRGYLAVFGYVAGFDNGYVYIAQKTVTDVLYQLREVVVEILCLTFVQGVAQVFVRLVRRTELYGFGAGQSAVQMVRSGCSGKYAYLERDSFFMFSIAFFRQRFAHGFRATCRSEPAETHVITVVDVGCGLFCRDNFVRHDKFFFFYCCFVLKLILFGMLGRHGAVWPDGAKTMQINQ